MPAGASYIVTMESKWGDGGNGDGETETEKETEVAGVDGGNGTSLNTRRHGGTEHGGDRRAALRAAAGGGRWRIQATRNSDSLVSASVHHLLRPVEDRPRR